MSDEARFAPHELTFKLLSRMEEQGSRRRGGRGRRRGRGGGKGGRRGGRGGRNQSADSAEPVMQPHIFQWEGGGREVFLVGSFNNWAKIPVNSSLG